MSYKKSHTSFTTPLRSRLRAERRAKEAAKKEAPGDPEMYPRQEKRERLLSIREQAAQQQPDQVPCECCGEMNGHEDGCPMGIDTEVLPENQGDN